MYAHFVGLLTVIPLGTLVSALSTTPRSGPESVRRAGNTYTLQDWYQGTDFFTDWTFFTGADPTGGNVNYLSMQDAISQGLAYVDPSDNSLVLAVDSTNNVPAGGNRNSVRITSTTTYSSGLFILDASAMPVGCGTWPSFWTNGPNWPLAGEIDIIEGINNQQHNQMTLHSGTSQPCTIDESSSFTGQVLNTQCYSTQSSDSGCSIMDTSSSSFAYGFNDVDGGVFALLWDTATGMAMYHFPRSDIPADITNQAPTPADWPTPAGFWSADTCDISANFYDHSMIIDTTICGSWAGSSAYSTSGCPGTCSEMVANATNFVDAFWRINYIAVYQAS